MGEYSMYWQPVYESDVIVDLVGSELVTVDTLRKWTRYRYFINKNNEAFGKEYSSKDDSFSIPINVDSFLTKQKVELVTKIEEYKCAGDTILQNNDLLRTFVLKASDANTYFADTLYLVYRKCSRNLRFEFIKAVDTVKDYRVVKGTAVYDGEWKQYIRDKKNRPFFRETYHELAPAPVQNYDKIYSLFQRFIKDTTQ